ncbi:DUF979 domain-containing protein [Sodalis endosymbiont of Spalangia cameroni]|uniref:DUF979 domain-containing protein n=1 Tax=Sodalis praecaptivus TaxID=1239307 RepID=UPI0031F9FA4C
MTILDALYLLVGIMFAATAIINLRDSSNPKRWKSAGFWGINAIIFIFGSYLPALTNGLLVIVMVLLAGLGGLGRSKQPEASVEQREVRASRFGNRLFIPALLIPLVTLLGTFVFKNLTWNGALLIPAGSSTLAALGLGIIVAFFVALMMLRETPASAMNEGRRLLDAIGWASVLPQMLAALGGIFALAGVGKLVAGLITDVIPLGLPIVAVAAYCIGMALFTIIMGNAFAAFPIMTAGIGLPIIVGHMGGNPAIMSAIGMLAGFCGTLMTPMAANFNIVPAALLELSDQHGVIKVQFPTAILLLIINIILMSVLVFRF